MSSSKRRKGFVLFVVLFIVSALASFLFSIYYLSQLTYRKTEELKDYTVAYHAAVSALKIALKFLKEDRNKFDGEGDEWSKPIAYNYRGISILININDECGKVNVNNLDDRRLFEVLKRLFDRINVEQPVADSIKDWIDRDNFPEPEGAEENYYMGLGYRPTNGQLKSLGELLYVKGIDEKTFRKLEKYLTIYGSGKVNVNSAPKEVLLSLSSDMSQEAADSIIGARPIEDITVIRELPGITKELYFEIRPLITNRCNYFRIDVTASYGDTTAQIRAFSERGKLLEWKVIQ